MVGSLGPLVGALDQGTSSTRFLVYAAETSQLVTFHQVAVEHESPQQGWVEQDPHELLDASITCINSTVEKLRMLSVDPDDIVSIGVTNQRETVVVWVGKLNIVKDGFNFFYCRTKIRGKVCTQPLSGQTSGPRTW